MKAIDTLASPVVCSDVFSCSVAIPFLQIWETRSISLTPYLGIGHYRIFILSYRIILCISDNIRYYPIRRGAMRYDSIESKILEFKEFLEDYSRLLETVTAFANTQGGTIIIGIRDSDRLIVGLHRRRLNDTAKRYLRSSQMPYHHRLL